MRIWNFLAAMVVFGCGGPNRGGGGDDDGTPTSDAATTGDSQLPGDAALPETGIASVTVLASFASDPIVGLPVVFSAKDGSLLGVEMTDASGNASHLIGRDAAITVVHTAADPRIETRLAVEPGDAIRFGTTYMARPKIATMHVNWPSAGAGIEFEVATRCGETGYIAGTSTTIDLDDRCASGTFDLNVIEVAIDDGQALGVLTVIGQTAVDGGTIHVTGSYVSPTMLTGTFTTTAGVELSADLALTYGGYPYFDANEFDGGSPTGTSTIFYRVPPAPGSELQHEVTVNPGSNVGRQVIGRRLGYTTQVGFDIGAAVIAAITSVGFDPSSRTPTWTTNGGAASDVIRLRMSYQHGLYETAWVVIAPSTVTSMTVPKLSDALAMYDIQPTDVVHGTLSLVNVGQSFAAIAGDAGLFLGVETGNDISWTDLPASVNSFVLSMGDF